MAALAGLAGYGGCAQRRVANELVDDESDASRIKLSSSNLPQWLSQKKVKDLEVIKEYYGYSNQKAKEALNLLSDDQIEIIKLGLKKGGRKK